MAMLFIANKNMLSVNQGEWCVSGRRARSDSLDVTSSVFRVDDLVVPEPGQGAGSSGADSERLLRCSSRHFCSVRIVIVYVCIY